MAGFAYIGSLSLGSCIPVVLQAQATVVPEFEAKIAGALEMQAALTITPPTVASQLQIGYEAVASLEASIGMPTASLDLSGIASILADLRASLDFWLSISTALGAGVYAWSYSGQAGGAVPGGIPGVGPAGVSTPANGVLILAADAGAWDAMKLVFGL